MSARGDAVPIGELARRTGCKVQTIRYYEQIGLMPEAARTLGNQRIYGPAHSDRLAFIRHSRELGFPLDAIRQLLTLADDPHQPCATADRIAQEQLAEVQNRIARLEALKIELERMVEQCRHGTIGHCRVIEVLADHSHAHCLHADHGAGEEIESAA
ncbi:DNA-binding transcriptional MerR regulator [Inquilinus ginsengisoli]|jgi:DNA-binding transcriptional MerR regulator|uniref:DNA-binding transcriptional MerR regulator n=1 Tax=Inquilinus ginsengisoli TaxID=363840 RepID=A0ABU1JKY4_9PROT|nr:helix-turn-helix domain-containing protein [Inquilinus ginsengisoli]MDR6289281.1 DNA-binding transcriptional MerR regulator [Inquilinus ginsengisoli]